jgi:hypothetical protein
MARKVWQELTEGVMARSTRVADPLVAVPENCTSVLHQRLILVQDAVGVERARLSSPLCWGCQPFIST